MQGGERYNSVSDYLKSEFGRKTVKLSIDAGFTCPNRDGTAGYGGCAFCSGGGSGELASHVSSADTDYSASISDQIGRLSEKWPDACYLAYFQSFTNTYAPVDVLRSRYYAALDDPRISGIAIATRPDCVGDDVLYLLEEINRDHFMWVELGLQSIHPDTLTAMNTCYTYEDYEKTAEALISRGIRVVTHLILGLPGETQEMMLESVRKVCSRKQKSSFRGRLRLPSNRSRLHSAFLHPDFRQKKKSQNHPLEFPAFLVLPSDQHCRIFLSLDYLH